MKRVTLGFNLGMIAMESATIAAHLAGQPMLRNGLLLASAITCGLALLTSLARSPRLRRWIRLYQRRPRRGPDPNPGAAGCLGSRPAPRPA